MPAKKTVAKSKRTFPIVGVGASAGGLEAFRKLLQSLPSNTGLAFVLVQHLDPQHESMLTKLLARATRMPVTEVTQGVAVEPDHVYVIPPNRALRIQNRTLHLVALKKNDGAHLPIDEFFRSLAENEDSRAIGVILSGVASDGTLGLSAIKEAGGITIAQDPSSATYDGMPRSAIEAGCVDFVAPPEQIGQELKKIGMHPYLGNADQAAGDRPRDRDDAMVKILTLLRITTGVDFTFYRRSTIHRRIARRMAVRKLLTLRQYLKYLHENRAEVTALYEDILIHVTGFFREPETFHVLKETILPRILKKKPPGEPLRIWVAGCSTGEEAYSVAITVLECVKDRARTMPVQIFATDISESALDKARAGVYSQSLMDGVSRERMERFFVRADGGYQIAKSIREMCLFARQDLSKDPPYSRLDLLTCRNVLIYLEPVLQKRVLGFFHYALRPDGVLVLGSSESISTLPELFKPIGQKRRIYSKKSSVRQPALEMPVSQFRVDSALARGTPDSPQRFDAEKEADRIVLNEYAPAGLVASQDLHILHFRGNVAPYLSPSPGQASLSVLKMIRPEFLPELRNALLRAAKRGTPVRKDGMQVRRNGHLNEVSLEAVPFKGPEGQLFFLVLFRETRIPDSEAVPEPKSGRLITREAARLQRELQATKDHLQSIIEEHEATNEELKSANEEVLSSNEELRSTNEELQTAQEELQSSNEELVTINEQLQNRNQELSQLSDDWSNLLSGLNIPVVMLERDRRIRRFTAPAEKLLNLLPSDIGRPIANIRPNFTIPDLDVLIGRVMDRVMQEELEIQDSEGRWYWMRLRPYRTAENRIDGVLMVFIDIDEIKQAQQALREQNKFSAAVMESAGALVMVTSAEGRVVAFNRACQIVTGYTFEELAGKILWNTPLVPKEEVSAGQAVYRQLIAGHGPIQHETHYVDKKGSRRLISWSSAAISRVPGEPNHIVLIGTDITKRREIEDALKASETALRQSQSQLQALTAGLLTTQEEERARVARELHDDINQKLAALNLEVERVVRKEAGNADGLHQEMKRVSQRLREVLRDVEETAHRLHPSSLDHLGLSVALKSYCAEVSKQYDIRVGYTERNLPPSIPSPTALAVYRVVQEALRNVVKHARSKRAAVSLTGKNGTLVLTIQDFGRGFDKSRPRRRGLGLISMEERVRQVEGSFHIKTRPGEGVRIEALMPLRPRSDSDKIEEGAL